MFSFQDLCVKPLGAADYIELSKKFHTIIVENIPKYVVYVFIVVLLLTLIRMTAMDRNEARRFITLIDVLYEHKVKFVSQYFIYYYVIIILIILFDSTKICSASVIPKELFHIGESKGPLHSQLQLDVDIVGKMDTEQQKVFAGEEELFMFARCCSRIEEMQTDAYLRSAHAPPK